MKPFEQLVFGIGAFAALFVCHGHAWADTRSNPYISIVDRNPFALKDPPPPVQEKPQAPPTPPAKVILTGITSLFGEGNKKALLEITEQEPGKPPNVLKPILREGERSGPVEVISIDVKNSIVQIRNGGQELDLKFEDPSKSAGAAARPAMAGFPTPPPAQPPSTVYTLPGTQPTAPPPPSAPAPTIISPQSADQSSRNSSVTMFGGDNVSAPAMAANNYGAGTYGGSPGVGSAPSPTVVSRTLRTPQPGQVDPNLDVKQYIGMAAHEASGGPPAPPVIDIDELRAQARARKAAGGR